MIAGIIPNTGGMEPLGVIVIILIVMYAFSGSGDGGKK